MAAARSRWRAERRPVSPAFTGSRWAFSYRSWINGRCEWRDFFIGLSSAQHGRVAGAGSRDHRTDAPYACSLGFAGELGCAADAADPGQSGRGRFNVGIVRSLFARADTGAVVIKERR